MSYLGMLGTVPFVCSSERVLTFSQFSKKQGARFASHDVIGRKPVLEYMGPSASTISMTIRLDAGLGVPPDVGLLLFEKMLESGAAQLLMVGTDYYGQFVVEAIEEKHRYHNRMGTPRVMELTIDLKEAADGGISGLLSLFA